MNSLRRKTATDLDSAIVGGSIVGGSTAVGLIEERSATGLETVGSVVTGEGSLGATGVNCEMIALN